MVSLRLELGRSSSLANGRGTNGTGLESRGKRNASQSCLFAVRNLRQIRSGIGAVTAKDATAIAVSIKAVLVGSSVLGRISETIDNGAVRRDLSVSNKSVRIKDNKGAQTKKKRIQFQRPWVPSWSRYA